MEGNRASSIRLSGEIATAVEVYRINLSFKSGTAAVDDLLRDRLTELGYLPALRAIDKRNKEGEADAE